MKNNIYFLLINIVCITLIQLFNIFPWWSFVILTFVMGFIFTLNQWKIKSFIVGFISGFLNWLIVSVTFHLYFEGLLIKKVAPIFYINTPLFLIICGIICGILNGLACYSGYSIFVKEDVLDL